MREPVSRNEFKPGDGGLGTPSERSTFNVQQLEIGMKVLSLGEEKSDQNVAGTIATTTTSKPDG